MGCLFYRTAGNFGGGFNLAVWRFLEKNAKLREFPGDVANDSTVSHHCNGVRVLCIAVFSRTCQLFSCCRAPNVLVNVVTTNAAINAENLRRCSFTVFARTVKGR